MNIKLKNRLRTIAEIGHQIVSGFAGTISSILRIILFTKIGVAIKSRKYHKYRKHTNCTILANGPSLKDAIEKGEVRLDNVDVFCVNSFCESKYFWEIKPSTYFIIDGAFFNPNIERCKKQVENLIDSLNKVDWEIHLAIPAHAHYGGVLKGINNPKVKILRFNTSSIDGYNWFVKIMCGYGFGMLTCINVVIFAIMAALHMKYKNIYMYGIDHTFCAQLFVDNENCVCSKEHHVYSQEPKIFKLPETNMAKILGNITQAFVIHDKLEKYSKSQGIKIYNCTKGSFVDSYERLI